MEPVDRSTGRTESGTPPYVDQVLPGSPAAEAGLRPDDLVVLVDDRLVASCQDLAQALRRIDAADPVRLTLLRQQELIEIELVARGR